MKILWAVLGWLALPLSVQAASFDCAKAQSKVEHIICDNPEISKLDEELAASYKAALQDQTRAEQIRQAQKQWMKERNGCADAECVRSAYVRRNENLRTANDMFARSAEPASIETPDKPGYFRLDKSNDNRVCQSLGRIINADIKKYGETRFDEHDEFVKWRDVDEGKIDRGAEHRYGGRVEQADVDINNDGVVDRVVRTKWVMSRVELDALYVLPLNKKTIVIDELARSGNMIEFTGHYWLNRYLKKYDDPDILKGDWFFNDGVSIELFRPQGATYIVARPYATLPRAIAENIVLQEYEAQPNVYAKIYIFQLDKDYRKYEEKDVCMFVRTCPCGGCEGVRGTTDEASAFRALPAKKWCNK